MNDAYGIIVVTHEPVNEIRTGTPHQRGSKSVPEVRFSDAGGRRTGSSLSHFETASIPVRRGSPVLVESRSYSGVKIHVHRQVAERSDPANSPASEVHWAVNQRHRCPCLGAASQKAEWWVGGRKLREPFNLSTFSIGSRARNSSRSTVC